MAFNGHNGLNLVNQRQALAITHEIQNFIKNLLRYKFSNKLYNQMAQLKRSISETSARTTVESAILARERLPLLTKSQPTDVLVDYFPPWIFLF